ncbi:oxidoreductase [Paenibacillus montaniterrae]|uniref:Oxidoreductase n=1 Tax=Paenibacillus montaniterrae TaxID=429341 RepID=A0A919YK19_9BACL|nr:FAD-dependent oxidoreductase [Paenibacillus montaniterrae]GIP14742.1 oxidoreductase [Paenibacillus montaniterrae]
MGFFQDMIAVFKKKELLFLESFKESDDVYSFLFEKPQHLTWNAGQYGLFSIAHKTIKNNTRPFSIASAPAENVVRITTRISSNPSDFKKALLELKQGMSIKMGGPVGAFALDDNSPSLLVAGGIGITPIRSILKQLEAEKRGDERPIHLLYMDSNQSYLFKDELDRIAAHTLVEVTYLNRREDVQQEIDKFIALHKDNGNYFVAGSKSMVDSVAAHVQSRNIPKRNIKKDVFFGY